MFTTIFIQPNKKLATSKYQTRFKYVDIAFLATALCWGVANSPAHAATAAWSAEQIVATSPSTYVRTAVNATGTSAIIWNQFIPGSIDATHPYGRNQVYGSVCKAQPAPQVPTCSASFAFTDGTTVLNAANMGAVVSPSGKVTVFWNTLETTPPTTTYSASASSSDAGQNWSAQEQLPGSAGYSLFGQSVGVDANGNIVAVMVSPTAPKAIYSVQALVKDGATGLWSARSQLSNGTYLFGSINLFVNSDGQALLNLGFTSFRRDVNGNWAAPQTVPIVGMGQIFSTNAGFDAGGKAYFVYRTHYLGAYLSTSSPTPTNPNPVWSKPKRIAKFDILGSSLIVRGSSAGHAIIFGNDMNTGNVRASVTADGGATWGALVNFGYGSSPQAVGSENGLFALSWDSAGTNWDRFIVAAGTGVGTGTTAWIKNNLAGNNAIGSVSIAGNVPGGSAQTVAGWGRWDAIGDVVGLSSGIVAP